MGSSFIDKQQVDCDAGPATPVQNSRHLAARCETVTVQPLQAAPVISTVQLATGSAQAAQNHHMPDDGARTTVMLRNLPNQYSRAMLIELLERMGFGGLYRFLYLPIDFQTCTALGYAFLDLAHARTVPWFWKTFDGFDDWAVPSKKVCFVSWCEPDQGLQAHIERHRSSPLMRSDVPDEFKPVLFRDGCRAPFPGPRRRIAAASPSATAPQTRPRRNRQRAQTIGNQAQH